MIFSKHIKNRFVILYHTVLAITTKKSNIFKIYYEKYTSCTKFNHKIPQQLQNVILRAVKCSKNYNFATLCNRFVAVFFYLLVYN